MDHLESIHRLYQMVEGFSVQFVRGVLNRYKPSKVFDPFVGAGTTLVEAMSIGADSVGVDINPFLCFASKVKTRTYEVGQVAERCDRVLEEARENDHPTLNILPIPKFEAYYSPRVGKKLLALKESIKNVQNAKVRELFLLIFSKISVLASNLKRSPAPRFDRCKNDFPILDAFGDFVKEASKGLDFRFEGQGRADVIRGDSRNLSFLKGQSFDLILTSPPYCNNVDYVRHTQLELFWLDYVKNSEDLGKLRESSLTSCEAMAHSSKDPERVMTSVRAISRAIERRTSRRWPRMVEQYFKGMEENLRQVGRLLEPGGRAVYVIGDSWIKGVHVPTHQILVKVARKEGYKVDLELWRERKGPRPHSNFLGEYTLTMTKHS